MEFFDLSQLLRQMSEAIQGCALEEEYGTCAIVKNGGRRLNIVRADQDKLQAPQRNTRDYDD